MSAPRGRLVKIAPWVVFGGALIGLAGVLAVASGAKGATHASALAAAIDVSQTCTPARVQPRANVDVTATVNNTGDVQLQITAIDGDAGTPDNTADDFFPTYQSGDTNSNGFLDPGEHWVYTGSYNALDEDTTNNIGVDAAGGGTAVSDIAPCTTDVIEDPVPGVRARVQVVRGNVKVKRPDQTTFTTITGTTEIPVGSQVNTLAGTLRLTMGLGGARTNTADFYAGYFTIIQGKALNALTILRLDRGNFGICRSRGRLRSLTAYDKSKRPVRRLWGSGKGRFQTKGRYSTATVRGTRWLTQDQCNGTLTRVLQGIVQVRDFRARRTVNVRAGRRYLARAPGA